MLFQLKTAMCQKRKGHSQRTKWLLDSLLVHPPIIQFEKFSFADMYNSSLIYLYKMVHRNF